MLRTESSVGTMMSLYDMRGSIVYSGTSAMKCTHSNSLSPVIVRSEESDIVGSISG